MTDHARPTRSGSNTRQRNFTARMRCTEDERAMLKVAADRAGMSLGMFLRVKCFGTPGPRAVRTPPIDRQAMAQAVGLLGRIGGNVNQIAHALNAGMDLSTDAAATLAEVRAVVASIRQAMGQRSA